AMGEHDGARSRIGAESRFGSVENGTGASRDAGIDEDPVTIAGPLGTHEDDIDHGQPAIGHIARDRADMLLALLLLGAGLVGKRNLYGHDCPPEAEIRSKSMECGTRAVPHSVNGVRAPRGTNASVAGR